jgi:hypothetical protein
MNTHVKTTFLFQVYTGFPISKGTFESLTTGSWSVVCDKMCTNFKVHLYNNDKYKVPTGYTRVSNSLTLPSGHLWLMHTLYGIDADFIYNVSHTVDNAVSSENITAKLFYELFDRLTLDEYLIYMRVSAAFTDLKFDFLTTLQ